MKPSHYLRKGKENNFGAGLWLATKREVKNSFSHDRLRKRKLGRHLNRIGIHFGFDSGRLQKLYYMNKIRRRYVPKPDNHPDNLPF